MRYHPSSERVENRNEETKNMEEEVGVPYRRKEICVKEEKVET